jgi:uncharacterized integral membrane protein
LDVSGEGSDVEGLTGAPGSLAPDAQGEDTITRRQHRSRMVAAGIVAAVITAFALVNLNDVKVHWLFATGQTPLIVVIAITFLLGMIVDRLLMRARRKRSE